MMTIMIMVEGTPNDIQIEFWQATTASNRYFLPVHSMLILCAINLIESKKVKFLPFLFRFKLEEYYYKFIFF